MGIYHGSNTVRRCQRTLDLGKETKQKHEEGIPITVLSPMTEETAVAIKALAKYLAPRLVVGQ